MNRLLFASLAANLATCVFMLGKVDWGLGILCAVVGLPFLAGMWGIEGK